MSREIKFRVWDTECEEFSNWTNRDPFFDVSSGKIFFWERVKEENGSFASDIILEDTRGRFILQQYTGLKDKNGVEIYEGDYVKITNHRWILADGQKEEDTQYLVEWSGIGFDFRLLNGYFMQGCGRNSEPEYEVVGNIFEKEP